MLSSKIVMRAWNAEHAAAIVRSARFQWRRMSAALRPSSTRCWGEKAALVRVPLSQAIMEMREKADVAASFRPAFT